MTGRGRYRLTERGWTVLTATGCAAAAIAGYLFPLIPPWL